METTRHYTATVYIVNDGATALHAHDRLGIYLPPGGHVERDELPHEAGVREVREETGLDPTLYADAQSLPAPNGRPLPEPQHHMLYDINVHDGEVGHQHIDLVFYARVESREIDPAPGEAPAEDWEWVTAADLRADQDRFEPDVIEVGQRAIDAVDSS